MPKTTPQGQNEAKNGIQKRNKEEKNSYVMIRTIKYGGILYQIGEQVDFTDKKILAIFLKNNYIK